MFAPNAVLQFGLPDFIPGLIAMASAAILLLMLVAMVSYVYKSMSGGIEWPEDREEDDDVVRQGGDDDEWDYY